MNAKLSFLKVKMKNILELIWLINHKSRKYHVLVVRGELMQDWEGVMAEFSAVLQFPYCFDLTEEMFDKYMSDLRWLRNENLFLIIRDHEKLLSSQEERERFLERLSRNIDAASERLRRVYNIERNIYIVCQSEA